ncbi:MAG: hypothetical protein ABW081_09860 [Solirubrobacteraceae bacterium]
MKSTSEQCAAQLDVEARRQPDVVGVDPLVDPVHTFGRDRVGVLRTGQIP